MSRPSRIAKRLLLPALLAAGVLVVAQVVLAAPPEAALTVGPQQAGGCGTFTFTEDSTDPDNDITGLEWNFGDGTTAPGAPGVDVTHTYNSAVPASRTVTLTATDADFDPDPLDEVPGDGIQTDDAQAGVTITNAAPSAVFTAPVNVQLGQTVMVTGPAPASDPDGIDSYAWSLPDDGFTAATQTATLNYATEGANPGLKELTLQTTDGCDVPSAPITRVFNVVNPAPTASFQVGPVGSSALQAGEPVTITSTSTDQLGGSIATYEWDLDNDGLYNEAGTNEVDGPAVTATFLGSTATIRLRVTDEHGGVDEELRTVAVTPLPLPGAGFTYAPANPVPGQSVTFTSTSTTAGPAIARIEWDFDYSLSGAFTRDAVGNRVTTSFATAGPKTVAVRAVDTAGGFTTTPGTLVVNGRPQASFTIAPRSPVEGREVTFASTSTDPDGALTKQEWDLDGNGRFERSGAVVTTTKLKAGRRTIRLRVTDAKGAEATTSRVIRVKPKPLKPPVDVKRSLGYIRHSWGIRLVVLIVKVPSKTTVTVKCSGSGCTKGTLRKRSTRKKGAVLRFPGIEASVRAGAKITVVTKRQGHVPAYDTYLVRAGNRSPLLREGCKPPGAKRVRALSSCSG